ncbi:MAG: HNH endonuclease [Anaerolineae bacterium]
MNEPVLVLNGNYEPINVCNTKRAMGLILADKAMVLENGRGFIRTVSCVYERPSVIRLVYMVHRPRPRVRLCKREILRRDGYCCQYCGRETGQLTIDHVVPRHQGDSIPGRIWWRLARNAPGAKEGARSQRRE